MEFSHFLQNQIDANEAKIGNLAAILKRKIILFLFTVFFLSCGSFKLKCINV